MTEPALTPENATQDVDNALRAFDDALPIALLRAREAVMTRFRPHLAAHGVTEQQWRVIRALADNKAFDATSLSITCCILMPSLSRILKSLEADGIITRKVEARDHRRQLIALSEKGRALFDKMAPTSAAIYKEIEKKIGREEMQALLGKLRAVRKALNH